MMKTVFEKTNVDLLDKVLSLSGLRQRLIAGNIANALTPGYIRKDLRFEQSLSKAMERTSLQGLMDDERHMPLGNSSELRTGALIEAEGETSMEREMAASAENQLFYSAAVRLIGDSFKTLKGCIRGRF